MEKKTFENKNLILNDRYLLKVKDKLGSGSFGQIFKGTDLKTKSDIAIKIESTKTETPQLMHEYTVLSKLSNNQGFPKVFQIFPYEDVLVLVMELLGDNLENLMQKTEAKKFSLKSVIMISLQILKLIQTMHENNFIHRDIKPENFVVGLRRKNNILHLIDFGIARTIYDKKTNEHIRYREDKNFMGNAKFCSIYTHLGVEQSRRDDLEALGYMMVYFLKGTLPWANMKSKNKIERNLKIKDKKVEVVPNILCEGISSQFKLYFDYVRSLQFTQKPDYNYLNDILLKVLTENNWKNDSVFEWCEKKARNSQILQLHFLGLDQNDNEKKEKIFSPLSFFESLKNTKLTKETNDAKIQNNIEDPPNIENDSKNIEEKKDKND